MDTDVSANAAPHARDVEKAGAATNRRTGRNDGGQKRREEETGTLWEVMGVRVVVRTGVLHKM